jgi:hypothetical protein
MSTYATVRAVYRWVDRAIVSRLPGQTILRKGMFHLARAVFPGRIQARSAGEFIGTAPGRRAISARLPAWARAEVAALAAFEPALSALVGEGAAIEPYFIPWDLDYVGKRYAQVRRQLAGSYACMVLSGAGASAVDMVMLAAMPRPLAVVDVAGDAGLAALAAAAGADYVALPAEYLDSNDHCAVLARLVLQVAPDEVRLTPHPLVQRCVQRHGLAMASVSSLVPAGGSSVACESTPLGDDQR